MVHLYNSFVTVNDIRSFVGRYCSSVSVGEKICGRYGIWNGKGRYLVRLKVEPMVPGGLLHPPGSFAIGPHQGFLHYPGQPLYCRWCGVLGSRGVGKGVPYANWRATQWQNVTQQIPAAFAEVKNIVSTLPSRRGTLQACPQKSWRLQVCSKRSARQGGDGSERIRAVKMGREGDPHGANVWSPTSWAEALKSLGAPSSLAQPEWAVAEPEDGLEKGDFGQEMEGRAVPSKGWQTRQAETTSEDRRPKRS
ncbi:hypothetical protein HF521_021296 [Silurus meridionalis]|uniref:Zinc finger CCHC domain-containing protein n=1 Tax=Silurus meridionalis TaxID=175797 RepID=A0A8T0BAX7_SILME|nr:hypothetical protein HF521_021296 [Silurus meridionalis]